MEERYTLYSTLTEPEQKRAWAEIDLGALRYNYRRLRQETERSNPAACLMAVVKAEAYGHGAPACVRTLLEEGCSFFAVSSLEEALAVRRTCNAQGRAARILVLGYTAPRLAAVLAQHRIEQALLSFSYAMSLAEEAKKAAVLVEAHAAVDTGMNRIGFPAHSNEEIAASAAEIAKVAVQPSLALVGMFSHFAQADEATTVGAERTREQSERYRLLKETLEQQGVRIPFHHLCNSAATLERSCDFYNGVRVGILLYGGRPSEDVKLLLRPVMKLKSVISHLHRLLPGEKVSYGGDFSSAQERTIATLPIGYADGLLRGFSGATVCVHTQEGDCTVPIVGRICMDQCMLDVTGTPAAVGDCVTFFGTDESPLHAYAQRAHTIDYECLCLISSRVTRYYIDSPASPPQKGD